MRPIAVGERPVEGTAGPRAGGDRRGATEVEPGIQAVYSALAADSARNERIVADVLAAVAEGRSPLVLTQRTEHRDSLAAALSESVSAVFVMSGGMGAKRRRTIAEAMAAAPP